MSGSIIDISKTYSVANEVDAVARNIKTLRGSRFEPAVQTVGSVWRGDAANMFARQCETMRNDLDDYAGALTTLAGYIREVARLYEQAEADARAAVK